MYKFVLFMAYILIWTSINILYWTLVNLTIPMSTIYKVMCHLLKFIWRKALVALNIWSTNIVSMLDFFLEYNSRWLGKEMFSTCLETKNCKTCHLDGQIKDQTSF